MFHKWLCDPATPTHPTAYSFLEPVQVRLRKLDGSELVVGFGIGDIIHVMEPDWCCPVGGQPLLDELPLEDGSVIVAFPYNMRVTRAQW
jgi:hypothetical protein